MGNNDTNGIIEPLIGPYGHIPLVLRDDDTNYFTEIKMLESIYSKAWDMGFKSSLAIIPNQENNEDVCVPPGIRAKGGSYYSILENQSLIHFLNKKIMTDNDNVIDNEEDDKVEDRYSDSLSSGVIEILQHGYSHSIINDRGEFGTAGTNTEDNGTMHNLGRFISSNSKNTDAGDSEIIEKNTLPENPRLRVEYGRNILRQAFGGNPLFFVPPYDDISYENIALVKELGMVPIFGDSAIHSFFRSPFIPNAVKKKMIISLRQKYSFTSYIVLLRPQIEEKNDQIRLLVDPNNILRPDIEGEKEKKKIL